MKILLKISKILIVLNIVGLILCNVGVPLTVTFTTNDKAASFGFFFELFCEFAPIALWCLGNRSVSSLKIRKAFKIGNRANIFIERLAKINLISGKSANLPRKVLPGSLEDLSEEARLFFKANNIKDEEIMEAINKRI